MTSIPVFQMPDFRDHIVVTIILLKLLLIKYDRMRVHMRDDFDIGFSRSHCNSNYIVKTIV